MSAAPAAAAAHSGGPSRLRLLRLLIATVVVLAIAAVLCIVDEGKLLSDLAAEAERVQEQHPLELAGGALAFYLLWTLCFIPSTLLELLYGYLFGLGEAYCITYTGKLLGTAICYLLVRNTLHDWAERTFGDNMMLRIVAEEAQTRPYGAAFLVRAAYIPLPLKNYGMPLLFSPLPLFVATLVVELADSYMLVAIGSTAKSIAEALAGGSDDAEGVWVNVALTMLEVALLVGILCYLGVLAKRALVKHHALTHHTTPSAVMV